MYDKSRRPYMLQKNIEITQVNTFFMEKKRMRKCQSDMMQQHDITLSIEKKTVEQIGQ
jgi:hypothetical protein